MFQPTLLGVAIAVLLSRSLAIAAAHSAVNETEPVEPRHNTAAGWSPKQKMVFEELLESLIVEGYVKVKVKRDEEAIRGEVRQSKEELM